MGLVGCPPRAEFCFCQLLTDLSSSSPNRIFSIFFFLVIQKHYGRKRERELEMRTSRKKEEVCKGQSPLVLVETLVSGCPVTVGKPSSGRWHAQPDAATLPVGRAMQ